MLSDTLRARLRYAAENPHPPCRCDCAGRIVLFKNAEYRRTPSDRLANHLRRAGWTVECCDPGLRPSLSDLDAVTRDPPTAIIRWEEQGSLFKNRRWAQVCAWCYRRGVVPLSVDYGYFDHFRTLMLDRYLPDGSSSIAEEWGAVSDDPVDWDALDPRLTSYRDKVRRRWETALGDEPLHEPGYVAVFMQYSPALCRLPYADARGETPAERWARRVYETLRANGKRVVFKKSPLNPKGRMGLPDGVPLYEAPGTRTAANADLNARIAAHASHVVMNCSSVANEFVLNDAPVTALGRSWFVRAPGVFHEPEAWGGICETPSVDHAARNKWMRWWLRHQGYATELPSRLTRVLAGFPRKKPSGTGKTAVRRACLYNDTLGAHGNHLGCRANMTGLTRLLRDHGVQIAKRVRVGRCDDGSAADDVMNYDLAIINGEGSVHSGNRRALGLLNAASAAWVRGVPVWLVSATTWGTTDKRFSTIGHIAVRETASYGGLSSQGVSPELAADGTFYLRPAAGTQRERVLACSGLEPPATSLCKQWADALGCEFVYCNDFFRKFGGDAVRSKNVRESFARFAASRFVISSSFHGCAFAALHCIPFLPVPVPGQPPKCMSLAAESMGSHASLLTPEYLQERYAEIVATMHSRLAWFQSRVLLNIPEQYRDT